MRKGDEYTNHIRLGKGVWDFQDFFPREENKDGLQGKVGQETLDGKNKLRDDRFTQSFLYLHQVLKRREQPPEQQSSLPYYLLHAEEQQGIFLLKDSQLPLITAPVHLIGVQATDLQRNYLHEYTRELRKHLEQTIAVRFKPMNRYYSQPVIYGEKNQRYGKVSTGVVMNLEDILHAVLFPLDETTLAGMKLGRVVYQLTYPDKEKVLGAGMFYTSKKKNREIHEVKKLSLS